MSDSKKPKVIAIIGPTATGKSHCGIALARKLQGEIISGDSMLVFRHMDIATAKPTEEELALVPHHLVNILEPDQKFSVPGSVPAMHGGNCPSWQGAPVSMSKPCWNTTISPAWTNRRRCVKS